MFLSCKCLWEMSAQGQNSEGGEKSDEHQGIGEGYEMVKSCSAGHSTRNEGFLALYHQAGEEQRKKGKGKKFCSQGSRRIPSLPISPCQVSLYNRHEILELNG